jgi:hypothetical protein
MSFSRFLDSFRAPKSIEELRTLAEQQSLNSEAYKKRQIQTAAELGTAHAKGDLELWKSAIARAIRNGHQVVSIDNNNEIRERGSRDWKKENKNSVPGLDTKRIFSNAPGYDSSDPSGNKTATYLSAYTNVLQEALGTPFTCRRTHHNSSTNSDGYDVDAYNEITVSWFK